MMMNRVIRLSLLANTRSATTAATASVIPAKKWVSSATPAKPRAPYTRRVVTPVVAAAVEDAFPVDPTAEAVPAVPVEKVKPVRKAAVKVEELQERNDFIDEIDSPLPEVPLMTVTKPRTAAAATATGIPTSTDYPMTPFPLSSNSLHLNESPVALETISSSVVTPQVDWTTSFHGLSSQPFSERAAKLLMRPLVPLEIEIKPDGLLYLPEILYRRILNQAFGPGGWGMVPRGDMTVVNKMVSREWGLIAGGRLVSVARGEQLFFDPAGLPTATEGCKSNALMRCCKDLGIAGELWDPGFIRRFKAVHCVEAWTEHVSTKKRQKRWRMKRNPFDYPLKEVV